MATLSSSLDILVIGAGQAGLALGFHLRTTPFSFQLVDRNARIGDSWRKRYDSLVLFTPCAYSTLPGLALPGEPEGYPSKDEIADYLEVYANHFDLPVVLGTGIRWLGRVQGGFRAITEADKAIDCRAVVLATGPFQRPVIPSISKQLSTSVFQLSAENYKAPAQLTSGRVLVVGDGATGRQIALQLTATHEVLLATGRPRWVIPEDVLGKSIFWWMDKLGILTVLRVPRETSIGQYLMKIDPFPGKVLKLSSLRRQGVVVVGRLVQAQGKKVTFACGESAEVNAVLWATGYKDDNAWVAIPEAKDNQENFVHRRGVSPVPGLYFIGRRWQRTAGSALFAGVGADALYLKEYIVKHLDKRAVYSVRHSD